MVSDEEKRRIAAMTEEERKAGLENELKDLIGDLLKIAAAIGIMMLFWRAYF